jgi:allantoicase
VVNADDSHRIAPLPLQQMSLPEREAALLACCASKRWAAAVASMLSTCRGLDAVLASAEQVWWELTTDDWREALVGHPRIGERTRAGSREAREQGSMDGAGPALREAIAEGNRAYELRFGMTYVVRAAGRSPAEMLLILRQRLRNDPETELRVAAGQQIEITRLRLADLLTQAATT